MTNIPINVAKDIEVAANSTDESERISARVRVHSWPGWGSRRQANQAIAAARKPGDATS